ncbi:MAG: ABC-three component system protein [Pseudobdellovibrionaceae bacterium]
MDYQNSNASGSQAGSIYQPILALNILIVKLTHFSARIGVEVLDDVTIDDQGHITLGQSKHTVNSNENPLNDLNKNLWKTLAIWLSYIKDQTPVPDTFSLFLYTNGKVGESTLAEQISNAQNDNEIAAVILEIRSASSKDNKVQALIKEITDCTDDQLEVLIKAIKLVRVDQSLEENIQQQSASCLALPDDCDRSSIYNEILGWFTRLIYNSWRDKKEAWVTRAQLNNQVAACLEQRVGANIVIGTDEIDMPPPTDISVFEEEKFVQHLKWIDINASAIKLAIINRLKYQRTRSNSVKSGKISYKFWEQAETLLRDDWDNARQEIENLASLNDAENRQGMGKKVYFKTVARDSKILNKDLVPHVVPGLYHDLANVDKVWWHPDYPNIPASEK